MSQALSIDMTDPSVQRMLGGRGSAARQREVVQIAGDTHAGLASMTSLTAGKHEVVVVYKDLLMTVDVYAVPGEPLKLHLYCPRCHKHSTVPGDRKAIDFDPRAPNPQQAAIRATSAPELVALAAFGKLSVEAFECPWEIGDEQHAKTAVHTGVTLCRMRLAIDNNRAKDA